MNACQYVYLSIDFCVFCEFWVQLCERCEVWRLSTIAIPSMHTLAHVQGLQAWYCVSVYLRMYVCIHVCMYACMHACMYVCMYASIYVVGGLWRHICHDSRIKISSWLEHAHL